MRFNAPGNVTKSPAIVPYSKPDSTGSTFKNNVNSLCVGMLHGIVQGFLSHAVQTDFLRGR